MTKAVQFPHQTASQELIAKLINAGYLQPALRNDPDAVTSAITRLKENLRGGQMTGVLTLPKRTHSGPCLCDDRADGGGLARPQYPVMRKEALSI
jgi:hypothetical protein